MTRQSTSVVRAKVLDSFGTAASGGAIFTHYKLQVSERLKGPAVSEVVVRGGTAGGIRQIVPGAPSFSQGAEYVLFLWAAPDGTSQVIGLTQGLFSVAAGASDPTVTRNASHELMLDPQTGHPVKDDTLVMKLSELRGRISGVLAGAGPK